MNRNQTPTFSLSFKSVHPPLTHSNANQVKLVSGASTAGTDNSSGNTGSETYINNVMTLPRTGFSSTGYIELAAEAI